MTSWHHEERLQAVHRAVLDSGAASVLDLGCGDGDLFVRLAQDPGITRLVGIDLCSDSLDRLRRRLEKTPVKAQGIDVRIASMTEHAPDLAGFDCAVLVETIEHIDPDRLSQLERAIFHGMRPATVIITTPNAEFNPLLGVPAHRFRHPDHRFEWPRARFRDWGRRVAQGAGYTVAFHDIAGCHPDLGGASQMAVFQAAKTRVSRL
ncbi:Methyltransferase domain-containing protein [Salinihabitans flavidus]|uniref:Small RNA 2'-O-methyltransferase n=1 Tax=Salinihabitans flavidus TaxID=569882 RepID=A0A1H8SJ52_9RHOB|nr:methyltransferase domain-containing protein [Salinihabitans flavidus]SEO78671.1 Methyltransferase domain-containing protein [Salinihabitans flavidus]